MKNVIYRITNIKNGKFYIGSAEDFMARKRHHLYQLNKKTHHSKYLQRAFSKYGREAFNFSIIETLDTPDNLLIREQYFINSLKPHYNTCLIACSRKGTTASKESLKRMSLAHKGIPIHTPESKAAISRALIGNKRQVGNKNKRKVTPEIVTQVMQLRASGLGCRKIAKIVFLDKTTILNIFNSKYNYGRD